MHENLKSQIGFFHDACKIVRRDYRAVECAGTSEMPLTTPKLGSNGYGAHGIIRLAVGIYVISGIPRGSVVGTVSILV